MPTASLVVVERLRRVLGGDVATPPMVDTEDEATPGVGTATVGISRGVIVICAVAIVLACSLFWRSRPSSIAAPTADALGTQVAAGSGVPTPPMSTPTPAAIVVVHVVGRVKRPGVVRLPVGSRVVDAIAAAGGLTRRTDPSSVNLARLLVDGEQLDVGVPSTVPAGGAGGPSSAGGSAATGSAGGLVDLNSATVEQLDALPGVGPVLAQRIVDHRTQNGRFASVDDLRQVSGIGDKKFADLAPLVRV